MLLRMKAGHSSSEGMQPTGCCLRVQSTDAGGQLASGSALRLGHLLSGSWRRAGATGLMCGVAFLAALP